MLHQPRLYLILVLLILQRQQVQLFRPAQVLQYRLQQALQHQLQGLQYQPLNLQKEVHSYILLQFHQGVRFLVSDSMYSMFWWWVPLSI